MFAWNGRHKLMAGVRTGAGAPNPLLSERPDPCSGPQYLGLWDTMCETDARGGVQTILKVHTSIKENLFVCENHERIALITDSETYSYLCLWPDRL